MNIIKLFSEANLFYYQMNSEQPTIQELFQKAVESHLNGNLSRALSLYEKVIERHPRHPMALHNLGAVCLASGDNDRAIDFLNQALRLNKDYPDALNNLSTALKNQKKYGDAVKAVKKALSLKPDFAAAYFNLGNLYREMTQNQKAIDAFSHAVRLNPNDYEVLNNLGTTLALLGRFHEAKEACLRSIALKPAQASTRYNLGTVYMKEGNLNEALKAFKAALHIDPHFSDAYLNMGNIMEKQGKASEAKSLFSKAIHANPNSADAYYNLGLALEMEGDLDNAVSTQNAALEVCPNSVQSWVGGARVFMKIADWKRVDPPLRKILNYDFSESENSLLSSALFMLHSLPLSDTDLYRKHCLWGDYALRQANRVFPDAHFDFSQLRQNSAKIRIGYVSPDFCRHSVGWFFKQIALHHDPELFHIHCYATDKREDDLTREIEASVAVFRRVHDLDTADLARTIHADQIHILVDLAGHTKGNRLDVFALRLAPVQVTAIGYPNGTGLETMDYRITDHHAETMSSMSHYREKLVLLSNCFLPFRLIKVSDIPIKREHLGLPKQGVLLVSFNRAGKLRPEVLSLWDRLLTRCPEAILALGCGHVRRDDLKANILSCFPSRENKSKVFFLERAQTEELHRARYFSADLALDTFPYAGTTTSYEALSMNVPVITLAGERHVQRTTYSILKHLGINETIARSEEEYLDKAAALIQDPVFLRKTKIKLSQAFQQVLKGQASAYVKELELAYQIMWNRYLRGQPVKEISS